MSCEITPVEAKRFHTEPGPRFSQRTTGLSPVQWTRSSESINCRSPRGLSACLLVAILAKKELVMAEAETLVKVLEGMIVRQTQLGDMIRTVHERAEANDLAMARLVGEHQQTMAQLVEDQQQTMARLVGEHQQAMARLVEAQGETMAQALQNLGQSLQAIMQSLERIVSTTDRTERMTAEVLARLATTRGASH